MRRLNSKLLLLLVAAIVISGLVIQGLHAYQVGRQSSAFLREADRAEKAGSPQEAADFLRTYLRLAPDDSRTTERLAALLFKHHQYGEARGLFGQLILRDQNNEEARRRLVDTSIRSERYQDAFYHVGFLLKAHPDEAELWLLAASAQEGLGQFQAAVDALQTAIKKNPGLISAYEKAAIILTDRLGDGAAAVALLTKMVNAKENRTVSEAYVARARFLQAHLDSRTVRDAMIALRNSRKTSTGDKTVVGDSRKSPDALQQAFADDVKEALRLGPSSSQALLLAAQAALASGSTREARDYAERAARQDASNAECYLALASVELKENHVDKAAECLTRGLRATDNAPALLWTLASLRLEKNEVQDAKTLVERLRPVEGARPIVRYLLARISIAESKWADATGELEGVKGELQKWPQLYKDAQLRLAQCYSRLGRDDWTVGAYRAALEADPDCTPARVGLVDALRGLGRVDEAIVELQRLRLRPDAPPHLDEELLRLAIAKTLALPPRERDWTVIDAQLGNLLNKPATVNVVLLKAEVELGKERPDDAVRSLRAALDKESGNVRLWTALASLTARLERWNETERLLVEMSQRLGDSLTVRLSKASYLVRRYGAARQGELRALAEPPASFSPSDRIDLLFAIGRMAASIQNYELAQQAWQKVAAAEPANLQVRLMLLDLAWQRQKPDEFEQPLQEIKRLEQNGPYSHYGEALKLAGQANKLKNEATTSKDSTLAPRSAALFDQAGAELEEARARFPSWPKIPLLAAQFADNRGNVDAALENYRAAFDLGERSPIVVTRLLSLLVDRQEDEKVESVVRQLIDEKVTFSSELTDVVSQALIQMGDRQGALALARRAASTSKSSRSAILLAQLLRVNGRPNEAEAEFQRAIKLAPREVSPWLALIAFYSSSDRPELAQKTVRQALAAIDPQQTWELEGYAYQVAGKIGEAEKVYDAALRTNPDRFSIRKLAIETKLQNSHVAQSQSLLREYLAKAGGASDAANLAWARRTLALSLAAGGTYPEHLQAIELIEKNLQAASASDADRRAQAMIEAAFPTFESRTKALETLKQLSERPNVLSPNDRIVMARLLRARGEWIKSSQVFRDVVAKSKDSRHLAAYIDAALSEKELGVADDWLRRLEAIAPNDFATADLRARLLAAQDRFADAYDRIASAVNVGPTDGATVLAQRRAASLRLEELGNQLTRLNRSKESERFLVRAETLLTGGERGRPDSAETPSVDHLQFLVRRGRGTDALAEFDRIARSGSLPECDRACMAVAAWPLNDPELLGQLERSLGNVTDRRPSYSAWVALASVQDRLQKYDAEEASYRRALALDDGTRIDALNNLAYLLALRKKELTEAGSLVDRAIALAGPRTSLLDSRALVEFASDQSAAALADLESAVNDGADAVHLFHLAQVRMATGQVDPARTTLKKALERGLSEAALNGLEAPAFRELKSRLDNSRG